MPLQSEVGELQAQLLQSQARQAELETQVSPGICAEACHPPPQERETPLSAHTHAQVRKLELEQAQHALLLESLQQRHQADLELLESTHRYCPPHNPWVYSRVPTPH